MALGSKLAAIGTGIVVRKISQKVLTKVWQRTRHTTPPGDPAAPGTSWPDALSYAVASGAAVGVGRVLAAKGTATAKMKLTGKPPKGMEGPQPTAMSRLTGKS